MEMKQTLPFANRINTTFSAMVAMIFVLITVFSLPCYAIDQVLVIRPDGPNFELALKGMTDELESEFAIRELIVTKTTQVKTIDSSFKIVTPVIVILMDNISITLFKQYQKTLPATTPFVPSISLMGIFVDQAITGLKNATGIVYEIPIVTSAVNLRSIMGVPLKKLGVVHRQFMKSMIDLNSEYCAKEGIEIVSQSIPENSALTKDNLTQALNAVFSQSSIGAVWIPNDNILLKSDLVREVWQPLIARYKKPIIVGLEVLANPQFGLGTFAVSPDHDALGAQAGSLILSIKNNNWQLENGRVVQPISIYKTINLKQAKEFFNVKEDRLQNVDKILK